MSSRRAFLHFYEPGLAQVIAEPCRDNKGLVINFFPDPGLKKSSSNFKCCGIRNILWLSIKLNDDVGLVRA